MECNELRSLQREKQIKNSREKRGAIEGYSIFLKYDVSFMINIAMVA